MPIIFPPGQDPNEYKEFVALCRSCGRITDIGSLPAEPVQCACDAWLPPEQFISSAQLLESLRRGHSIESE